MFGFGDKSRKAKKQAKARERADARSAKAKKQAKARERADARSAKAKRAGILSPGVIVPREVGE